MDRDSIINRFRQVDTSNVADVLDGKGLFDQSLAHEIRPFPAGGGRIAGFAYTIRGQMTPYEGGGDPDKMTACAGLSAGDISVWSGDRKSVV